MARKSRKTNRSIQTYALSRPRDATDVPVSMVFLFLTLVWILCGIFVIHKGDITKFLVPRDSKGRYCSEHKEVLNKPNIFFFDPPKSHEEFLLAHNTTQVCVKNCPSENFDFNINITKDNWNQNKHKMICANYSIPASYLQAKQMIDMKLCAMKYSASHTIKNRCFPKNSSVIVNLTWLDIWVNNFIEVVISNDYIKQNIQLIASDLNDTYMIIIKAVCYGLVITFVYIALLRWIAGYLVWSSILLTIIILITLIVKVYIMYSYYSAFPDLKVQFNFLRPDSLISYFTTDTTIYFCIFIVLLILLLMMIFTILFLQEQIKISIALIKESSKAVASAFPVITFPVLPLALQIICLIFAGTVYTSLTSLSVINYQVHFNSENITKCICENIIYEEKSECNPRHFRALCEFSSECSMARCERDMSRVNWYIEPLKWLNLIMFLWVFNFISAAKKMIFAFVFATWYWTWDKSTTICKLHLSIYYTFRYHSGTIAFGSLIITIFKVIQYIFEKLYKKFEKLENNSYKKSAKICCNILFVIFEKFIRILNENAYIMCAIYGRSFLYSAKKAFFLLVKNPLRYYVLSKSLFLLFLSARIVISSCIAVLVHVVLQTIFKEIKLNYSLTPVITVGIITFFVSKILFTIYEMAVYTIFICFCEDCEQNDGSEEKPYYMAKKLKRILPKFKDDDPSPNDQTLQSFNI